MSENISNDVSAGGLDKIIEDIVIGSPLFLKRLVRGLCYSVAACVLAGFQEVYNFSSLAVFLCVFMLAITNRMRWISEALIVLFVVLAFVPKEVWTQIASVLQ